MSRNIAVPVVLILVLGILLPGSIATAQPPGPRGPRNGWSIGVGAISSPEPYIGADDEILVIPVLSVTAGRFSFRGIGASWQLGEWGGFEAEALLRARFGGFEEDDSPFLEGMEDRRFSADLGLELSWEGELVGVRLVPAVDVLDRSGGAEVALELFTPIQLGPVRLEPRAGAAWQSSGLVDYYYGVRPGEARPGRPAYRPGSTVNGTVGLFVFAPLADRVTFQSFIRFERLGSEIEDSPIVADTSAVTGLVGISYRVR